MVWRAQDLYDGEKAREEGAAAPRPLHLYGYGSYGICIVRAPPPDPPLEVLGPP